MCMCAYVRVRRDNLFLGGCLDRKRVLSKPSKVSSTHPSISSDLRGHQLHGSPLMRVLLRKKRMFPIQLLPGAFACFGDLKKCVS